MPYKLSATLAGHTGDVRGVAAPSNDLILSASRDTTAISWQRPSPDEAFTPASVFKAGSRYVNSVTYIPPSEEAPKGYVVTGGLDTTINVFNLASPKGDPDFSLLGHTDNVCALDASVAGTVVSGSWDSTAKVWKKFQLTYDLRGHQLSVMAVLMIQEDDFVTGSSDKTIKLWTQNKCVNTLTGHKDAVRGLTSVPDIGFASCSNDSEVRVWTLGGDLVYTLSGHTSFVYSLSVLPSGDIVSGGEDRSVRIWKDGECAEVVVLPALSVWTVAVMPNGDIVTGSSDSIVRVFSASEDRWASASDLKAYDDKVAAQSLPSETVGNIKKSDLPGLEALTRPGKRQGENILVKNGDTVEAHQWDSISGTWHKIGDVTDAVGSGRTQTFEGKEYDYVFDVDIQDGVPPLKLPYNASENPYTAAQRFLQRNELPMSYIDQVADFIQKNTAGVTLGTGGADYSDPFTGASRYRSSAQTTTSQAPPASYSDPFTGTSRYVSNSSVQSQQPASAYMDPFTGGSRYSGSPAPALPSASATPSTSNVLPATKFILFKQVRSVTAIQNKIYELDNALRHEISTTHFVLYPEDVESLEETISYLAALTTTPSDQPPLKLAPSHIETIIHTLDRWPISQRFPVIDLGRLVAGFSPEVFESSPGLRSRFFQALFKASDWDQPWDLPLQKPRETNLLLTFKALANAFQDGHSVEPEWLKEILTLLDQAPYEALGKTQRASFVTVLYNISCLSVKTPLDPIAQNEHIALLLRVLTTEKVDAESAYRALVGLGNVIHALKTKGGTLNAVQPTQLTSITKSLAGTFASDSRVKNIVQEINALL